MASEKLELFASRYVRRFAGAGFAALAPVFVLNAVVDPYEILRDIDAQGYFERRPDVHDDRITIPYAMRRSRAEVLLVGSSRARYLISDAGERNPDLALTRPFFGERRVFNAAVAGTNAHVLRRVVEYGLHRFPLREAVLLVDDVALNVHRPDGEGWKESRYATGAKAESRLEALGSLLNLGMARISLDTVLLKLAGPSGEEAGQRQPHDLLRQEWRARLAEFYRSDLYGCYELGKDALRDVEAAVRALRQRGVTVYLLAPTIHAALMEVVWRTGNWSNYAAFLGSLSEIGERHGALVFHFSPYASLADEEVPRLEGTGEDSSQSSKYFDPGHARQAIGRAMLSVAKALPLENPEAAAGFGARLTHESLPREIARLERERQAYLEAHPEILGLLPAQRAVDCGALRRSGSR